MLVAAANRNDAVMHVLNNGMEREQAAMSDTPPTYATNLVN